MQWTKAQLLRAPQSKVDFDEDVTVDPSAFHGNVRISGTKNIHVSGEGFFEPETDRFYADLHITGTILCPDAITGREVEVPMDTETEEVYSFQQSDEDGVRIVTDEVIELMPAVAQAILLETPLQVIRASRDEYPHGEGWKVYTEEDYEASRKDQIDPRLAKLKDFKEEK